MHLCSIFMMQFVVGHIAKNLRYVIDASMSLNILMLKTKIYSKKGYLLDCKRYNTLNL